MIKKMIFLLALGYSLVQANDLEAGWNALQAKEYAKAAVLFERSCNQKNGIACYNLGLMYQKGNGVKQNCAKALALYEQACKNGEPAGCENLDCN